MSGRIGEIRVLHRSRRLEAKPKMERTPVGYRDTQASIMHVQVLRAPIQGIEGTEISREQYRGPDCGLSSFSCLLAGQQVVICQLLVSSFCTKPP